jgi:hypothetical protein
MPYPYEKIGSKVKEYNGVTIYVSRDGVFYADAKTNSSDFNKNTFQSPKISAIESAIDDFKNVVEDGKEFYLIDPFCSIFKKLKVISNVGTLLFFDDGTDTKTSNRSRLYPIEVEKFEHFEAVRRDIEKAKEIEDQIKALYKEKAALIESTSKKMAFVRTVKPSI